MKVSKKENQKHFLFTSFRILLFSYFWAVKSTCVEELVEGIMNGDYIMGNENVKWGWNWWICWWQVFVSFLKSFEEPCSECSVVRTITKVRLEIVPKISSSGKKWVYMYVYSRSRKCISGPHRWLNIAWKWNINLMLDFIKHSERWNLSAFLKCWKVKLR